MRKPTWGDTVRVKDDVPPAMCPGRLAAVCGMRKVETSEQANQFGCGIGTVVYLVEFEDGSSVEIPEELLEIADDDAKVPDD